MEAPENRLALSTAASQARVCPTASANAVTDVRRLSYEGRGLCQNGPRPTTY